MPLYSLTEVSNKLYTCLSLGPRQNYPQNNKDTEPCEAWAFSTLHFSENVSAPAKQSKTKNKQNSKRASKQAKKQAKQQASEQASEKASKTASERASSEKGGAIFRIQGHVRNFWRSPQNCAEREAMRGHLASRKVQKCNSKRVVLSTSLYFHNFGGVFPDSWERAGPRQQQRNSATSSD